MVPCSNLRWDPCDMPLNHSVAACAVAPSLAEVLDRPAAVAESLLFPFDGGVRPMKPAFAPSSGGDTGARLRELGVG